VKKVAQSAGAENSIQLPKDFFYFLPNKFEMEKGRKKRKSLGF